MKARESSTALGVQASRLERPAPHADRMALKLLQVSAQMRSSR